MRREEEEGQEDDIIVHVGRNKVGGLCIYRSPKFGLMCVQIEALRCLIG